MSQNSEKEFLSDMRIAVSCNSSKKQREEAIGWQIGRSANHDQKILTWLAQLEICGYFNKSKCQPLVRAVYDSSTSSIEELLRLYIKTQQSFRSAQVLDQVRDVVFGINSHFLNRFKKLDEDIKHRLLSEVLTIDPYQSRFSLEICRIAECCDWGALHRLLPGRDYWISENDIQGVAVKWFRVWETYQDIHDINDKGAS